MEGDQLIHDHVRVRAPVVDVADDVQPGHAQRLDGGGQGADEVAGHPSVQDRPDHRIVVLHAAFILILIDQFVNGAAEIRRHLLPGHVAGVLGADHLQNLHQPHDGEVIPAFPQPAGLPEAAEHALRVVDHLGQLIPVLRAQGGIEKRVDLVPDGAGGAGQHPLKAPVLPVQVGKEVFRALGQLKLGFQPHDLRRRRALGGKIMRKQPQIGLPHIGLTASFRLLLHVLPSVFL